MHVSQWHDWPDHVDKLQKLISAEDLLTKMEKRQLGIICWLPSQTYYSSTKKFKKNSQSITRFRLDLSIKYHMKSFFIQDFVKSYHNDYLKVSYSTNVIFFQVFIDICENDIWLKESLVSSYILNCDNGNYDNYHNEEHDEVIEVPNGSKHPFRDKIERHQQVNYQKYHITQELNVTKVPQEKHHEISTENIPSYSIKDVRELDNSSQERTIVVKSHIVFSQLLLYSYCITATFKKLKKYVYLKSAKRAFDFSMLMLIEREDAFGTE